MESIAHIRLTDNKIQTVEEHLIAVKQLAEIYGDKMGVKHIAGLAGMLHDMGKYSQEFLSYITAAAENPDSPPKRGSVNHSSAGGKILYDFFHIGQHVDIHKALVAEIVGNAIISHHGYLYDFLSPDLKSDYLRRVQDNNFTGNFERVKISFFDKVIGEKEFMNYVDKATEELNFYLEKEGYENLERNLMFLTKFIFSALIDADRTNTRMFEENEVTETQTTDYQQLFETYYERLMEKLNSFYRHPDSESPINILRRKMSEQCEQHALKPSGIYTLSIPTGGGKTLASLRYALKHARLYNKTRIIYVVPFTTIIEQNANEVRKIINDNSMILEHHSNVVIEDHPDDEAEVVLTEQKKLKLAKDNWDVPLVFTTMVQFLDIFYAKSSRDIRRLHNLCNSIIIFDEVQKVPTKCISLFNQALNFLKLHGNASILLCTATQPALDFVEHKLEIDSDAEIIEDLKTVSKSFKRVEIIDKVGNGSFNSEDLVQFIESSLSAVQNILVILNTKSVVRGLYNRLKEKKLGIPIYHLSTSMCAAHRKDILEKIKRDLKNQKKFVCISTQLIEAGVDVSFDCVIRSLAGLDSIAQAAGRCNRHGEKDLGSVFIVDHQEENLDKLKEIKVGKKIAKKILLDIRKDETKHGGSILSDTAMKRYFKEFYTSLSTDLNYSIPKLQLNMTDLLMAPFGESEIVEAYRQKYGNRPDVAMYSSIKTAAKNFRVIDSPTTSVIVPYEKGEDIIAELMGDTTVDDLTKLFREAQQYTVNIYEHEKKQLTENDGLVSVFDGEILVAKKGAYAEEYGLEPNNNSGLEYLQY